MTRRYWSYNNNRNGGPAGYSGDWDKHVLLGNRRQWGGSYSTKSPEVWKLLNTLDALREAFAIDEESQ